MNGRRIREFSRVQCVLRLSPEPRKFELQPKRNAEGMYKIGEPPAKAGLVSHDEPEAD